MRKVCVGLAVVAVVVMANAAVAQDPAPDDVKGAWNLTIDAPQGPVTVTATFEVDGDKVSGQLSTPAGSLSVTGTVSGASITFGGSLDVQGQSIALSFSGTVSKEAMSGTVDFGGMGSGAWKAEKAK